MAFTLCNCVIHDLIKTSGKQAVSKTVKTAPLPKADVHVLSLVQSLFNLIGKKENQAARGTFDSDGATYKAPGAFKNYYEGNQKDNDFIAFTVVCMNELEKQAKDQKRIAASGGAIVFAHCIQDDVHFMLVTMIKQKDALQLDANLKPVASIEIDLSKINQAARINFDKYGDYIQLPEDDDNKPAYLAFVSPKSNSDASGYFVAAIGCTDSLSTSEATDLALTGVKQYFDNDPAISEFKSKAYDTVLDSLKKKGAGKITTLDEVEHLVRQAVPGQLHANVNGIVDYLNGEEIGLPFEFGISNVVLNKRSRVRTKTDGWEFVFERRMLGTADGSDIKYIKNERKIIISNLTPENITKIEKALEENDGLN